MLFGCAVFSKKAVSPLCVGADACIGPPVGLAESGRVSVAARSRPQCRAGDLARRMGACAAAGLPGRCKHRPLRMRGQGPAGVCRIFPPQSGNAPLRLRLAAHPPPLAGEALGELPLERLPCKGLRSRAPPAAEKAVSHAANGRHSFYYRLFGDRKHRTALRSPLRSLPLRGNAAVAGRKCASAHAARCGHRKPVMSAPAD